MTKMESFVPTFKTKPRALKPAANSEGLDVRSVGTDLERTQGNRSTKRERKDLEEFVCAVAFAPGACGQRGAAELPHRCQFKHRQCYCWITLFANGSFG